MPLSAGIPDPVRRNNAVSPIAPTNSNFLFGSPESFSAAATTQAGDYDRIMDTYKQLGARQSTFNPLTPQLSPDYNPSAGTTAAISSLTDISKTGGYTPSGIADIRARGIAPVRSIFASAQQGLQRQKNLSGGYSPNFAAASAKMAREASDVIAGKETDVNAQIAENVARNRLSGSGALASASEESDRARMAREEQNTNIVNQINQLNESIRLQVQAANNQNLLSSAEGMKSLYATTPALTQMFGNQVAQAAQMGQNQQQINDQKQARRESLVGGMFGR